MDENDELENFYKSVTTRCDFRFYSFIKTIALSHFLPCRVSENDFRSAVGLKSASNDGDHLLRRLFGNYSNVKTGQDFGVVVFGEVSFQIL